MVGELERDLEGNGALACLDDELRMRGKIGHRDLLVDEIPDVAGGSELEIEGGNGLGDLRQITERARHGGLVPDGPEHLGGKTSHRGLGAKSLESVRRSMREVEDGAERSAPAASVPERKSDCRDSIAKLDRGELIRERAASRELARASTSPRRTARRRETLLSAPSTRAE